MPAKSLIKEEYVNNGRQTSFDYLKAFAVIFMVMVHVLEEWTVCDEIGPTFIGDFVQFLGGPLAAPVFMFSMGVGIVYSKHRSPGELIKRGIKLLAFSYVFNILRFCISYIIFSGINGSLRFDYLIYYIMHVDILNFAGLTFIVTGLLKKMNVPLWGMLVIALVLQGVSNLFPYEAQTLAGRRLLSLFIPCAIGSFFPLFNWFIYPVAGMLTAKYLKQSDDLDYWHKIIFYICSVVLFGVCVSSIYYGIDLKTYFYAIDGSFYLQNFFSTVFSLSIVGIAETCIYFGFGRVKSDKIKQLFTYMSNNLNTIYVVQWLIIGNIEILFQYGYISYLPVWASVPLGLIIAAVSVYLNRFAKKKNLNI